MTNAFKHGGMYPHTGAQACKNTHTGVREPGMVVHACNPSIQEAEAEEPNANINSKQTCLKKKKQNNKNSITVTFGDYCTKKVTTDTFTFETSQSL